LRLGLPISLIIALAIGFVSFLNYYNYRKTYQQLNVARVTVVARDLRQAIESGLNVGLAPRSNTQLATSLTIAKDHTDGLRFAAVVDVAAKRLVQVGAAVASQDWLRRLQRVGGGGVLAGRGRRHLSSRAPVPEQFRRDRGRGGAGL